MQRDCLIKAHRVNPGPGDRARVIRPDGSSSTLLRHSPTSSRSPDAFVQPHVVVLSSDEVTVVCRDDPPGFVLIATRSGDIGYVQVAF